jgi:hypothetical protein
MLGLKVMMVFAECTTVDDRVDSEDGFTLVFPGVLALLQLQDHQETILLQFLSCPGFLR